MISSSIGLSLTNRFFYWIDSTIFRFDFYLDVDDFSIKRYWCQYVGTYTIHIFFFYTFCLLPFICFFFSLFNSICNYLTHHLHFPNAFRFFFLSMNRFRILFHNQLILSFFFCTNHIWADRNQRSENFATNFISFLYSLYSRYRETQKMIWLTITTQLHHECMDVTNVTNGLSISCVMCQSVSICRHIDIYRCRFRVCRYERVLQ